MYNNIRKKGKNGQSSKWAYYYCKCILNGKKDVPQKFVQADAKNVTGQSINKKLTKAEYTAKMKKYCEWVEKHKSLPNYITIKDKKVNVEGSKVTSIRFTSGATVKKGDNYFKFVAEKELDLSSYDGKIEDVEEQLWADLNSQIDKQVEDLQ